MLGPAFWDGSRLRSSEPSVLLAGIAGPSSRGHTSDMDGTGWQDAYGHPFDPRPVIEAWAAGRAPDAVGELWGRLYHQGGIGTASYVAVPALVATLVLTTLPDWNAYALIASVEEARLNAGPPVPSAVASSYRAAWEQVLPLALSHLAAATEDVLVRSLLAVIALAKGQRSLAAIALCTEDERQEMLGKG